MAISGSALQTTLKSSIDAVGIGLHSGKRIGMVLHPAAPDSGIVFRRVDLEVPVELPALWSSAEETPLCSTLSNGKGASVLTIEHLMAALSSLGVDNCRIDLDGPEVPIMDGSAEPFVFLIECAGLVSQNAARRAIQVKKRVEIRDGLSWVRAEPASAMSLVFEIDFPSTAIGRQRLSFEPDSALFKAEIGPARTFGFAGDVARLHAAGQALGASLANAVVVDGDRIVNPEGLRFPDEFVRHKLLDAIGDLALAGAPLVGRFTFHRSSHALNRRLLAALLGDRSAWSRAPFQADFSSANQPVLATA